MMKKEKTDRDNRFFSLPKNTTFLEIGFGLKSTSVTPSTCKLLQLLCEASSE